MRRIVVLVRDQAHRPAWEAEVNELTDPDTVIVIAPSAETARSWLGDMLGESGNDGRRPVCVGDLEIDQAAHCVRRSGRIVPVTEKEFQLLVALSEEPGRAWSFEELMLRVWDTDYGGQFAPVRCVVQRLRKKLCDAGSSVVIESVRAVGFRLVAEYGEHAQANAS